MSVPDVARAAKVDFKTVRSLESGDRWPQSKSRAKIEQALDWPVGTIQRLQRGEEIEQPPVADFDLSQPTPVAVHATTAWVIISRDYPLSLMTLSRREAARLHERLGEILAR